MYVLEFELEGQTLVKIGITSRNIEDRVSEILVSIFHKYRMFPYCRPKRFRKVKNNKECETILHKWFEKDRYITEHKFSGSTEFFAIKLEDAVSAYENLLNNKPLDYKEKEDEICEQKT